MKRTGYISMVRTYFIFLIIAFSLQLLGCNKNSGPTAEIHDTKYVAIGVNGDQVGNAMRPWPCVLDQYSGLMWEVKSDATGLHDWRNTYSWYNPEESNEKEGLDYRGTSNGGQCDGSDCDTWAYVHAVNDAGHCGHHDWRIPVRDELASISDQRKIGSPPTINTVYFLNSQSSAYWSSNDYHFQYDSAWVWDFEFGHDRVDWKKSTNRVRLVRGKALQLTRVKD